MYFLRNIRFVTYAVIAVSAIASVAIWRRSVTTSELASRGMPCMLSDGSTSPKALAALLKNADHVLIKGENEKEALEVIDSDWIHKITHQFGFLKLGYCNTCLCSGWTTAYFYQKDLFLGAVAPIHGNQIRIYSDICSGDFEISESSWSEFNVLFNEKRNRPTKR